MTTYRLICRGGEVIASERDRFRQFDGELVPAPSLTTAHTVPGRGRVLNVEIIDGSASLPCSHCEAWVPDLQALEAHGRDAHRLDLSGKPLLRVVG